MCLTNRKADKFTKSKLFGGFKRVLYMQQNKNGILFSYICSFKKRERGVKQMA